MRAAELTSCQLYTQQTTEASNLLFRPRVFIIIAILMELKLKEMKGSLEVITIEWTCNFFLYSDVDVSRDSLIIYNNTGYTGCIFFSFPQNKILLNLHAYVTQNAVPTKFVQIFLADLVNRITRTIL
jgi:hypothetical protein